MSTFAIESKAHPGRTVLWIDGVVLSTYHPDSPAEKAKNISGKVSKSEQTVLSVLCQPMGQYGVECGSGRNAKIIN